MSSTQRRNLVCTWLAVHSAAIGFMTWSHATEKRKVTEFDEINVHRINIIEPGGKPRVIIASKAQMSNAWFYGKEYQHRSNEDGGFLFFNDDGSECGGMGFGNDTRDGRPVAASNLNFDQYNQDSTVRLMYGSDGRTNMAGLSIVDRPDKSIVPLLELVDQRARARTDAERASIGAKLKVIEREYEGSGTERFFAGKGRGDSVMKLADKHGRSRLMLKVDAAGAASLEFLDENGKVTQRITAQ
jgi:hypothetical protein